MYTKGTLCMPEKGLIKISEAAAYCGVSTMTVKRWISAKKIKAKMINGRYYIRPDDLKVFINKD